MSRQKQAQAAQARRYAGGADSVREHELSETQPGTPRVPRALHNFEQPK